MDKLFFAIVSNKGGVGKTSAAICFGFYFANILNKRTLLVELDSSPGDFGPLFDISDNNSLDIAIKFPERFKNYIKSINKNLDVLKGFSNPINAEAVTEIEFYMLLENISQFYEVIIFDTQTVLNGIIIDALKFSDIIILLSEPTIESLSRIAELISILNNKFLINKNKFHLVINKKKILDLFKIKDITKILNFPVRGFISYDKNFNKNFIVLNTNKLFKSKFNNQICKLINNIISSNNLIINGEINELTGKA